MTIMMRYSPAHAITNIYSILSQNWPSNLDFANMENDRDFHDNGMCMFLPYCDKSTNLQIAPFGLQVFFIALLIEYLRKMHHSQVLQPCLEWD